MLSKHSNQALKISKVLRSRESWRRRSNKYQTDRRKLQDKVRYLESYVKKQRKKLKEQNQELSEIKKKLKKHHPTCSMH